ncbi:MAG: GNAT family N-acetyltransferase [Bacilli bacterium]
MDSQKEKSCGAVIYKRDSEQFLFLILRMHQGHYSLCKGHVEEAEDEVMTAYREIKEETNLDVVIDTGFRHLISYRPYKSRPKVVKDVVFFLATPYQEQLRKQDSEIASLRWLDYEQALDTLTHPSDRDVLKKAFVYIQNNLISNPKEDDALHLAIPSQRFLPSYYQAEKEAHEYSKDEAEYILGETLQKIENSRLGIDLPQGWVKSTVLWLVLGDEFIGGIAIRHELTPSLLRFGGHIGYHVRNIKRGKGYGTKMLALALNYARDMLGLTRVLITCNKENIASSKVIEANGGILENEVLNVVDGEMRLTKRYWIDIK